MRFTLRLRDVADELGLGFVARSYLALAVVSDVADAGRGGILCDPDAHHAHSRGKIRRQWGAHGDHASGGWRSRGRDHSRLRLAARFTHKFGWAAASRDGRRAGFILHR